MAFKGNALLDGTTGKLALVHNPGVGAYGGISVKDSVATTSVSSAGFTQMVGFITNDPSDNATPDHTNDHITIGEAGKYLITVSAAVENNAGAGHVVDFHVGRNNNATMFDNLHGHRTLSAGADKGSMSALGIATLSNADTIELWFSSDSGAAKNITISDCCLSVTRVG